MEIYASRPGVEVMTERSYILSVQRLGGPAESGVQPNLNLLGFHKAVQMTAFKRGLLSISRAIVSLDACQQPTTK